MPGITRRDFTVGAIAGAASFASAPRWEHALGDQEHREQVPSDELQAMRDTALAYMKRYDVPGMSVAIARSGQMVFEEGFGFANVDSQERVSPKHLFRIASVSKPITSVAIFRLIESGKLRISDRVFGRGAVLGTDFGTPPYGPHIEEITVHHLLTHTAGGWTNDGRDPMFSRPQMNHAQLISWTLDNRPLDNPPGEKYAYSNFGYCVLGRVIEKLSGRPYDASVKQDVLSRCGVRDMRIAGDTLAERLPNEVVYYGGGNGDPYGMKVARMDSHGGWVATAPDLVRFALRVDGFATVRDILKPETLRVMTTGTTANPGYACGWSVNTADNWWHMGGFAGATSILVRTHHGFCWAALTNTRGSGEMQGGLDRLIWDMVGKASAWRA